MASLWFRSMDLTITSSTNRSRGPSNERKNVAATEKQLESMVYRLTQERGWWPFLTARLENATDKTKENAPPLVKQIWSFLEDHLEVAEAREMTVTRFVTAADEVTIGEFWREHAKGELRTRRNHEILKFLSPCWGKEFMARVFCANETIFGAFLQELLSVPISLLLALYLVFPRYLFNMDPAYMISWGVETLRIDGYLALVLLTHGELVSSINEIWGAPVDGEKPLEHRHLFIQECCRAKDATSRVSLDAESIHDWLRKESEDERRMEKSEWWYASVDRPMPGDEIGPNGDNPGAGGGRNLHLWTGRDIRIPRSSSDSLSQLRHTLESHKCIGRDSAQLVSARGAKGTNEQHGALRKTEGARVDGVQFPRTTTV